MAYKVSRFALMYSPPTLMVEFNDPADGSNYVKKINLKNIANVKASFNVSCCCWLIDWSNVCFRLFAEK